MPRHAERLLEVAEDLARLDPNRPRQASLRRAVSTAYYALFHLFVEEATSRMFPDADDRGLRLEAARQFAHEANRLVFFQARSRDRGRLKDDYRYLGPDNPSPNLDRLSDIYLKLHRAREEADYNLMQTLGRADVKAQLSLAKEAFRLWTDLRNTAEGRRLVLGLMLLGRTRRRPDTPA